MASAATDSRIRITLARFAALLALFLVHDYCAYFLPGDWGPRFALLLAAMLLAAVLVDAGFALVFFVVVLVFSDDIPRLDPGDTGAQLSSLLTVPLGGVAIGNLVVLTICAIGVFVAILKATPRENTRLHSADACVAAVVVLYLAASVHGHHWLAINPRGALNDWNLPLMLAAVYAYVRCQANKPEVLTRLWSYLFLAIGAKAVAWAAWFYLGVGVLFGTSIRVATESGRVLLVFCLIAGFICQEKRLGLSMRERALALGLALFAAVNLLVDASRGPWLMSAFGLAVILLFGSLRGKIVWVMIAMVLLPALGAGVYTLRPHAFDQIGYFWSTLQFWEEGNIQRSQSTMIRVHEFQNIHAQLVDRENVLLGEGPGSRFSDAYHPFPFGLREHDYTFEEIRNRSFENPHGLLPNLMLDTGYGGLAAYLSIMLALYAIGFRAFRRAKDPSIRAIALSILAFLPAIVYMSWSPKINMLVGIFIGMTGALHTVTLPDARSQIRNALQVSLFARGQTS